MRAIDINEVIAGFDELIDKVANGTPFILMENGVPRVRFEPVDALDDVEPETD